MARNSPEQNNMGIKSHGLPRNRKSVLVGDGYLSCLDCSKDKKVGSLSYEFGWPMFSQVLH